MVGVFVYVFLFERGMLIQNFYQERLVCQVAVIYIIKHISYVQWNMMEILIELCLLKVS